MFATPDNIRDQTPNWASDAPQGGRTVMNRILKENATVPLFFAQTLIASLRDVGYNTTTSALCEHVDNAIEAGAQEIRIYFRQKGGKGSYEIDAAVYDDGRGMSPNVRSRSFSFHPASKRRCPELLRVRRHLRLLPTILGTLGFRPTITPAAVGLYISAASWFTASTSLREPCRDPRAKLSDTFAGIVPASSAAFIVCQFAGALVAAFVAQWMWDARPR